MNGMNSTKKGFDSLKQYLSSPPVLMPPRKNKDLKLYISASEESIGTILVQDSELGKEQAIYYLSRVLTPIEHKYSSIKKLCLSLYFASQKLRTYMLPILTYIVCETNLIKCMLTRSILKGRIGKWSLALMEFSIQFKPHKAVKGQALANFLADHPSILIQPDHGYSVNSSLVPCVALIP